MPNQARGLNLSNKLRTEAARPTARSQLQRVYLVMGQHVQQNTQLHSVHYFEWKAWTVFQILLFNIVRLVFYFTWWINDSYLYSPYPRAGWQARLTPEHIIIRELYSAARDEDWVDDLAKWMYPRGSIYDRRTGGRVIAADPSSNWNIYMRRENWINNLSMNLDRR